MDQEQGAAPTGPEVDLSELRWREKAFDRWRARPELSHDRPDKIFDVALWPDFCILHDISFISLKWAAEQRYRNKKYF